MQVCPLLEERKLILNEILLLHLDQITLFEGEGLVLFHGENLKVSKLP